MTSPVRYLLAVILLTASLTGPGRLAAQAVSVQGAVLNASRVPIPGLTVSLVHPVVGRGYPAITDVRGVFTFYNVPLRADPYYLEIYWGQVLYYRQLIYVTQPLSLGPIFLN